MVRIKQLDRWGPLGLGALLLAACPVEGADDPDEGPSSSAPGTDSGSDPPTDDTPTGEPPPGPTTATPTTDAPTTGDASTGGGAATTGPGETQGDDSTTTGIGSGETGDSDGSGGSTDATPDTTTGAPGEPGASITQLVSAGKTASSANFRMVFTLGQPTQHQGTHQSQNFRLQGGLSGANGATP